MSIHVEDREAIRKAIMDFYHQAHVQSNPELYDSILHDRWQIFYFHDDGSMAAADKAEYQSWYNPEDADQNLNWETRIYSIDVYENLASVKLWIGNQDFGYVDYFNMMKIDGKWWIVHKISQRADDGPPE